jgi:hypothetical protein
MFKASWSKEDGLTSFWTFLVVTLLALIWARGAATWGTRFRLEADFEESGWLASMNILIKEDYRSHQEIREGKIIILRFWTVLLLQKR